MVFNLSILLLISLLTLSVLKNRNAIGLFIFIYLFLPQEIEITKIFGLYIHRMAYLIFSIYVFLNINTNTKFPLKRIFILLAVIFFIPFFNSPIREGNVFYGYFVYFLPNFFLPSVLLFYSINEKEDLKVIIKWLLILIYIWGMYSIFEYVTISNPFIESLKIEFENKTIVEGINYDEILERFGRISRIQCTVWHPIAFGIRINLILALLIFFKLNDNSILTFPKVKLLLGFTIPLIIIILMSVLTNSRSVWLQTFICIVIYINSLISNIYNKISLIIITILIGLIYFNSLYELISVNFLQDIGGSSLQLRSDQFYKVLEMIYDNLIWGLGYGFIIDYLARFSLLSETFGFESLIFTVLIEFGLVGLIGYIFLFINIYQKLKYIIKKTNIIIFLLPFITTVIITGEMQNFGVFLLFTSILFSYKHIIESQNINLVEFSVPESIEFSN